MQMKTKRQLVLGEGHHWWPENLLKEWEDENGKICRIDYHGEILEGTRRNLAKIKNGHNFIIGKDSSWNHTFEGQFDKADNQFPSVIEWLEELKKRHLNTKGTLSSSPFLPHDYDEALWQKLSECIASLVVRSPCFRNRSIAFPEGISTPSGRAGKQVLIAANIMHSLAPITEELCQNGKYVIVFSTDNEFIFGDGFYHNLSSNNVKCITGTRILIPLTPSITVFYVSPNAYRPEPKLMTATTNNKRVQEFNETIQIYSKDYLFYRTQKPELSEHFCSRQHMFYSGRDRVYDLMYEVPGVEHLNYWDSVK